MRDFETLVSLVAGLIYFIIHVIKKQQRYAPPQADQEVFQAPTSTKQVAPKLSRSLPQAYTSPYASPGLDNLAAKGTPTPLSTSKQPVQSTYHHKTDQLAQILAKYQGLQKAVVAHEILQTKYIF